MNQLKQRLDKKDELIRSLRRRLSKHKTQCTSDKKQLRKKSSLQKNRIKQEYKVEKRAIKDELRDVKQRLRQLNKRVVVRRLNECNRQVENCQERIRLSTIEHARAVADINQRHADAMAEHARQSNNRYVQDLNRIAQLEATQARHRLEYEEERARFSNQS